VRRVASAVSACLLVGGLISIPVQSAFALEGDRISVSQAQGKTGEPAVITVSPYGVALTFIEVGELIENAWVIDSSNLGIGYDLPPGKGAKIVFLKAIKQVSTASPGTSLTVTTRTKAGVNKVYNFLVEFSEAKPKYTIVRIYPDATLNRPASSTVVAASPTPTRPSDATPSAPSTPATTSQTTVQPSAAAPTPTAAPQQTSKTDQATPPSSSTTQATNAPAVSPPANPETRPETKSEKTATVAMVAQNSVSGNSSTGKETPIYAELRKIYPVAPTPTSSATAASQSPETASAVSIAVPQVATSSKNIQQRLFYHSQANALVRGLALANRTGEVGSKNPISAQLQSVIRDLRKGQNLQASSKSHGVEWKIILRLLQLGDYKGEV
jgi:hypothetical protein